MSSPILLISTSSSLRWGGGADAPLELRPPPRCSALALRRPRSLPLDASFSSPSPAAFLWAFLLPGVPGIARAAAAAMSWKALRGVDGPGTRDAGVLHVAGDGGGSIVADSGAAIVVGVTARAAVGEAVGTAVGVSAGAGADAGTTDVAFGRAVGIACSAARAWGGTPPTVSSAPLPPSRTPTPAPLAPVLPLKLVPAPSAKLRGPLGATARVPLSAATLGDSTDGGAARFSPPRGTPPVLEELRAGPEASTVAAPSRGTDPGRVDAGMVEREAFRPSSSSGSLRTTSFSLDAAGAAPERPLPPRALRGDGVHSRYGGGGGKAQTRRDQAPSDPGHTTRPFGHRNGRDLLAVGLRGCHRRGTESRTHRPGDGVDTRRPLA